MTFKLSSPDVSIVSGIRIKKASVIPFSQLWAAAVFHRKGAKSAKKDFFGFSLGALGVLAVQKKYTDDIQTQQPERIYHFWYENQKSICYSVLTALG